MVFAALVAMTVSAAEFSGFISDAKCKHADEKGAACAQKCVKGGAEPVLVSGDKVYKFEASTKAKVMEHVGHKVTITGTADGDTIKVESVKM
jgi:hypothetical protein